ncbi:MAG: hypothetical protein HDT38_00595 [Clostridiales bacterium]|nr:hypothetical protein [Clostridiales bacterium]
MKKLPQIARILLGGLALFGSAILSWILEYYIGNLSMLVVVLGGAVFAALNPELMGGQ